MNVKVTEKSGKLLVKMNLNKNSEKYLKITD